MAASEFSLSFEGASAKQANIQADELKSALVRSSPGLVVTQQPAAGGTMDLGTILTVLLTADAVVAVAKGLGAFLRKYHDVKVTIKNSRGEITLENIDSQTALSVVEDSILHDLASDA
jgi:hypothetical protein